MSQSTLKRRTESRHSAGEKRPRSCFPISDSFEHDRCSACENELTEDVSVCINLDLPPSVYFSLALMMTDCSQYNLLQHHYENNTIKTLAEYANRLTVERDLADGALGVLRVLLQDFEANNILRIRGLMKKTSLHQERELKFISSCLSDMKISIRDTILENATIDWEAILMSDIRFARLMPLFAILRDSSKDALISPIASFVSLPEIFDDNDIIVLSFTSTSCEGQEDDSQFILSSSEETNARDFILPRLSSVINSQESVRPPDTQITAEFSITSSEFNIPSSQWVPATNSSQHTISDPVSDIVLDQDEDISLLDIPDYEEFTNVELKSKLKAYGYKAGHNRNQMIKDLRTIYTSIHSSRNSSRSSTPTNNKPTTTTTNFSPDLLMAPVIEDITFDLTTQSPSSQEANSHKTIDPTVKESIIRHLKSKTNIWQKILTFSPVTIEECILGTKFSKSDIKLVLDEAAATYGHCKRSNESK